jgi:hypothetical protein
LGHIKSGLVRQMTFKRGGILKKFSLTGLEKNYLLIEGFFLDVLYEHTLGDSFRI